jgi:hypothetical protein
MRTLTRKMKHAVQTGCTDSLQEKILKLKLAAQHGSVGRFGST